MPTADSSASKEVVTAALLVIGKDPVRPHQGSERRLHCGISDGARHRSQGSTGVGDEETAIVDALNALRRRCTYVSITGGSDRLRGEGVRCVNRQRSARARHPARMSEDDRRRDERGAPAHDAHSQGCGPHPQKGVGGAWLLYRQCNRVSGRALRARDARKLAQAKRAVEEMLERVRQAQSSS
jgi:hypothetical protein